MSARELDSSAQLVKHILFEIRVPYPKWFVKVSNCINNAQSKLNVLVLKIKVSIVTAE